MSLSSTILSKLSMSAVLVRRQRSLRRGLREINLRAAVDSRYDGQLRRTFRAWNVPGRLAKQSTTSGARAHANAAPPDNLTERSCSRFVVHEINHESISQVSAAGAPVNFHNGAGTPFEPVIDERDSTLSSRDFPTEGVCGGGGSKGIRVRGYRGFALGWGWRAEGQLRGRGAGRKIRSTVSGWGAEAPQTRSGRRSLGLPLCLDAVRPMVLLGHKKTNQGLR